MRNDGSFSANAVWPAASSSRHPGWLAPGGTGIHGLVAELLLDAHELVVLGVALGAAGRAGLDLARAEAHGQVGDGHVLGLTGAVRGHDTPAALLAELHRVDRLSHGTDLVDLQEQGVARLVVNRLLHARDIGHGEVITDHLRRNADLLGEELPSSPIILVEGVLDRDHGVVVDERLVQLSQFLARHLLRAVVVLSLEIQVVQLLVALPELRCSDVHAYLHLTRVARLLDGGDNEIEPLFVVQDIGSKATLVSNIACILAVLGRDHLLEVVVHLRAHAHCFLEGGCANGKDHELLHCKLVACVRATVDDIKGRNRHVHLIGGVV
mmetsp:Transcript_117262/g.163140  ORF Transcript_117262/g.163140 Transcript_117262/m.163140 type:complete len:324 (-) Transcript_117262:619-1590(-)